MGNYSSQAKHKPEIKQPFSPASQNYQSKLPQSKFRVRKHAKHSVNLNKLHPNNLFKHPNAILTICCTQCRTTTNHTIVVVPASFLPCRPMPQLRFRGIPQTPITLLQLISLFLLFLLFKSSMVHISIPSRPITPLNSISCSSTSLFHLTKCSLIAHPQIDLLTVSIP